MNPDALAVWLAQAARPRLMDLLKLKGVEHIYDFAPGRAPAKYVHQGHEIVLDRFHKSTQPYRDIHRFLSQDRVQSYLLDPGLIPAVKSILTHVRGHRFLATKKVAPIDAHERGAIGHLEGFGMRIVVRIDPSDEWQVTWECLYGVA